MRLLFLGGDDQALDLARELVGVANGATRAVGDSDRAILLVTLEQLVAGLALDAELAADVGHRLALEQSGDETQAFIHDDASFHGIDTLRC